ncbi:MAG: YihY/virulence factor BrkB family protein [Duncaniella sp.]|nr:YihY/virulence factor BrkB family protein [Duncaniella sp.]
MSSQSQPTPNPSCSRPGIVDRVTAWWQRTWDYVSAGVWRDTRTGWRVNIIKTLNLTVRSFFNKDLQTQACSLTYQTMLAIVPALALLFAIGRGFGFQSIIQSQLFRLFPSQQYALEVGLRFIDGALAQASEGVFVGVGIVVLLWTIISLLMSVEDSFNTIWNIREGRSIFRKLTDYTAICIILPILMICSGGLQILVSTTIQKILPAHFISPVTAVLLDVASYVLAWLFFTAAYMLIPNTKVKFTNAFIAGVLAGTSFQVLQWLFASGQLYVSKYNAIYGTFSFLPLMLLWLQFSWLITLTGALICYSSQNFFRFSFEEEIDTVSLDYRRRVALSVLTVIVHRFETRQPPLTVDEISARYEIPPRLTELVADELIRTGLVTREYLPDEQSQQPLIPAMSLEHYTIAGVLETLRHKGSTDFIPQFNTHFAEIDKVLVKIDDAIKAAGGTIAIKDISFIPSNIPEQ